MTCRAVAEASCRSTEGWQPDRVHQGSLSRGPRQNVPCQSLRTCIACPVAVTCNEGETRLSVLGLAALGGLPDLVGVKGATG